MMQDRYRKRYRVPAASLRMRQQIALEAARRIFKTLDPGPEPSADWLEAATTGDLYAAKRKAAAVLGHRVRPGDLPSDAEVREQLIALARSPSLSAQETDDPPEPEPDSPMAALAEHLDRFAIYKMRLEPLEAVQTKPQDSPRG